MKHFITFQKKRGLFISTSNTNLKVDNSNLVHEINHELMAVGYVMTKELFDSLSGCTEKYLGRVYTDIVDGIRKVVGTSGYEPIYRNFPQSVLEMSYTEFFINAIVHYWSAGTWRPEDADYINKETKLEVVNYKEVGLLTENGYHKIFSDILYSGTSISKFDKECLDFYIINSGNVNLSKIKFKETLAYVGKRLFNNPNINIIGTKNATDILRMWAAYSGGDEGLKENTKFKNPTSHQARVLRNTLNECYNLEDSFKTYREQWLKFLFYLNPLTIKNAKKYNILYGWAKLLRNDPKLMETFNAKVERMIKEEDPMIFNLLVNRKGVFTRRLDHLVRVFGETAIQKFVTLDISFMNLVTAYNHFTDRDKEQAGRGAILANQNSSTVVTYDALKPLSTKLVTKIKALLFAKLSEVKAEQLNNKKVYIDRIMYYTPLTMNNRASSLSLDSKALGTSVPYTGKNTIRMYVHWEGRTDIDLSGMVITKDLQVIKIGWDGSHRYDNSIVYSGDNTGYSDKNAEYLDINVKEIPSNIEWIIVDANIYSGPSNFNGYNGKCHAGWMEVSNPKANNHWQPKTLSNAIALNNKGSNAYLMAFHVPSKNVVYLDMQMGSSSNITTSQDAIQMKIFLESFITLDDVNEINWYKLNQGHLISILADNIVENSKNADIVFDNNTSLEEVSRLINQ